MSAVTGGREDVNVPIEHEATVDARRAGEHHRDRSHERHDLKPRLESRPAVHASRSARLPSWFHHHRFVYIVCIKFLQDLLFNACKQNAKETNRKK